MDKAIINKVVDFIKKYKILHVIFWTWSYLDLLHLTQQFTTHSNTTLYINVGIIKLGEMCAVYLVVYYLMPRFLRKERYVAFLLSTLATFFLSTMLTLLLQDVETLIRLHQHMRMSTFRIMFMSDTVDTATITAFFFVIYTVQDRFDTERRNRLLEKDRLESELSFLKAQINPHFLFNAINSIYVLIDEDKKLASQTLLKFSGLLRYQLYDCNNDHMPLAHELDFLRDYIELEKLRNGDNLAVSYTTNTDGGHQQIAPFMLITFVENAFKHRSHNATGNYVQLTIDMIDNTLILSVANTYDDEPVNARTNTPGGIGMQNVYRRLELLYAGKYELDVIKDKGIFTVKLKLKLHENAMHTGR